VAVAAGLVLLGWAAGIEPLKRIQPGWVAMNPTTALLFLVAAAALWLQAWPRHAARFAGARRAAQALAGVVAVAGAVKLGEHLGLAVPAIDQWLFALQLAPDAERGFARNEMAPNTAVAFVLVGMALALLDRGTAPGRRPAEWLAAGSALIALLALLGYAYRIEAMYGVSRFIPMAMNTAALFLLLALGVFAARPATGISALFQGGRPSGRMARRLLAGSIAIIAGVGWLRLEGERAGLYGNELGVTLHSVVMVALFALLVASSAWVLRRAEDERRRAEIERERALARNRLIMDNSLDVICTIDGEGRFVDVSPAARQLWGYAPEELAGREYMALVHPDDREATARVASSIRAGQPTVDFSNRYLRSDGTPVVVDWSAAWSEPDQLMFCVARDATRRRQAEDRLRQSEERIRRIIDTASDAFVAIDAAGLVTGWNRQAEVTFGWTAKEALGQRLSELIIPRQHREAHERGMRHHAVTGEGPVLNRRIEITALRRDGGEFPVELAIWQVHEGGSHTFNAFVRDISERRRAEDAIRALNAELHAQAAELRQSNRELESFSYTISHDLRAPLRHIDGYARMLQEDAADALDGDCRRYLDEIGLAARRMGALIDDLLAFSRLGRKPVERVPLDMHQLVERVVEECGGTGKVTVGRLPEAQADPVLLRQVWVNLVSNALKYSAPRGEDARVKIDGRREDGRVEYRIRDNGVGFDMRYADKLFGVFQRLHSQEEFEGTGVGLAIVQQIVARHGGSVRAESAPGAGATFTFDLPAGEHAAEPADATEDMA
jgi:PAS domain S-box-containing protein